MCVGPKTLQMCDRLLSPLSDELRLKREDRKNRGGRREKEPSVILGLEARRTSPFKAS